MSSIPLPPQATRARTESDMTEEGEGADPVGVMKSLLSMAIYNISYIRGVFHEKYFNDESVPELEMKFKMLMPMDDEARKLIDWMEKGVYDALHKKYLKTLLFSTYEEDGLMMEEYAWSNKGCIIKSNASDVTPHQMRSSACKMIRRLVSLMRTLDPMPDKQTIIMKMEYNEDITPIDYQSPFLKFCAYNDTINVWNENSLKMEMNDVSSKHLVLVLKVKKILEPCDNGNFSMSVDNESDYDCFSNTEPPQRRYGYVFASSSKKTEFVLDSGATHHVCNDKSIMRNMKDVKKDNQITLYSCGGRELKAEFMGSVVMKDFRLSQVGYIPNMAFNVVSVGQLASQGLLTQIVDSHFTFTDVNDAMLVGEGFLQKRKDKANEREYIEYIFRTMNWDVPGDDEKLIDNSREDENQNDQEGEEWMIDTGCEMHMVPELGILRNPRPQKLSFQAASGTIQSTHKGSVKEGKLVLKDVLYCRDLRNKLISVGRLDLSGHRVTFSAGRCTIVHKDGLELQGVGVLDKITNMYLLLPEKEKNEAGTEAEKNPEEEDGKNGSFMAEEDNGMRNLKAQADVKNKRATAEEIQCRLTRDTKCTKNKKARGQDKGKAAKRQRHK